MAKPKSLVDLKRAGEDLNLGNFKSLAQKRASERNGRNYNRKKKITGQINCKKAVKAFLETNDVNEAAKQIGLSRVQTTRYLQSEEADKLFKEIFIKIGIDKQKLAEIAFNDFLEYNKQKIKKVDERGREVEEMRDGRLAFKAFEFVANKLEKDKGEIEINHNINITSDTASLAIKQLINKIEDIEILRDLQNLISNKILNHEESKIIEVK